MLREGNPRLRVILLIDPLHKFLPKLLSFLVGFQTIFLLVLAMIARAGNAHESFQFDAAIDVVDRRKIHDEELLSSWDVFEGSHTHHVSDSLKTAVWLARVIEQAEQGMKCGPEKEFAMS